MSDEVVDLAEYRRQKSLRRHDWTAISHQFQAEEDHAAALCNEILTGPSAWWPRRLHKAGSAALTVAMARTLGLRMAERIESAPADALVLSSMAMEIATRLLASTTCSDSIILKCYTDSMRDHAYVLSCLGRCEEGIGFVAAAEAWREDPAFYDDHGLNALVKAVLLRKRSRHRAAARLARKAASAFAALSDHERYRVARRIQAAALYDAGQTDRALALRACLDDSGTADWADEQRLAQDITACLYAPADSPESVPFDAASENAERIRSEWLLAKTSIRYCGPVEPMVDAIRVAWQKLTALGFPGEGALAALDVADARLLQRRAAEIPPICDALIAELTPSGLAPRALAALSLLRKAATLELASPELVKATRVVVWGTVGSPEV